MEPPCEKYDVLAIVYDRTVFDLEWTSVPQKAFVTIGGVGRCKCEQRVCIY